MLNGFKRQATVDDKRDETFFAFLVHSTVMIESGTFMASLLWSWSGL